MSFHVNSHISSHFRPKKVILFPKIDRVKNFLSTTRPHKSNVYENIFFVSKTHTHTQTKKISTSKFICKNLRFSLQKIREKDLCFSTKKSAVRVVFKCKQLKNSIKLTKKFFCSHPSEDFFRHPHFRKQEYNFFLALLLPVIEYQHSCTFVLVVRRKTVIILKTNVIR